MPQSLLIAIGDPATVEVVRRKLHRHLVTRKDLDVMHAHLALDMGQNLMAILKLDFEHRVGERLDDLSL